MVNLWRVVQNRFASSARRSAGRSSRELFGRYRDSDRRPGGPRGAVLLPVFVRRGWESFAVSRSPNPAARLDRLHARIQRVWIESLDAIEFIRRYQGYVRADRPDRQTFFFIDPPYMGGTAGQYSAPFDHAALAETVKSIPGPWLMTLNDSPEARELYSGCPMVSISRNLSTENRRGRSVNRTYRERSSPTTTWKP